MTALQIDALIDDMARETRVLIERRGLRNPGMIGIHTGGLWVAQRLHSALGLTRPLGALDISFYRDDFTRVGLHPQVKPSHLPFSVDDRHILLVDDVLHTGRTVRAALNEIFDYGRPATVTLLVLVERSGRELPIEAAIAGQRMDLAAYEHVKLSGPDPLTLSVLKSP